MSGVSRHGRCVQPLRAHASGQLPSPTSASAKIQMRFVDYPMAFLRGSKLTNRTICHSVCCSPLSLTDVTVARGHSIVGQTDCANHHKTSVVVVRYVTLQKTIVFTARCICISAVYAVTRCPSVCLCVLHVRELRQKE